MAEVPGPTCPCLVYSVYQISLCGFAMYVRALYGFTHLVLTKTLYEMDNTSILKIQKLRHKNAVVLPKDTQKRSWKLNLNLGSMLTAPKFLDQRANLGLDPPKLEIYPVTSQPCELG